MNTSVPIAGSDAAPIGGGGTSLFTGPSTATSAIRSQPIRGTSSSSLPWGKTTRAEWYGYTTCAAVRMALDFSSNPLPVPLAVSTKTTAGATVSYTAAAELC